MIPRPMAAAAFAVLAACAAASPSTAPRVALTPVPVTCAVDPGAPPDFPDTEAAIRAAPDIFERAKLYAAGRLLRIGWEARLSAALAGCASPAVAAASPR